MRVPDDIAELCGKKFSPDTDFSCNVKRSKQHMHSDSMTSVGIADQAEGQASCMLWFSTTLAFSGRMHSSTSCALKDLTHAELA